jgi:hypothetical protein
VDVLLPRAHSQSTERVFDLWAEVKGALSPRTFIDSGDKSKKAHLHEHLVPIGRIHQDPIRLDPLGATLVALVCPVSAWRVQVKAFEISSGGRHIRHTARRSAE